MSQITIKHRITELSKQANRSRAYRGRLAEEYDGIGQYVMISLSQNSVSAAFSARVASGDFGTGQKIPVGTPVTVILYRGKLEIVSMGAK